jgi:hypothetical protein
MKSKKSLNYFQQGDVLVKPTTIPEDAKPLTHRIFREGEHTGHMHAATAEDVVLLEKDGVMFARIPNGTNLTHQEHHTIFLPPGDYQIDAVQEYDHFLEESRAVLD